MYSSDNEGRFPDDSLVETRFPLTQAQHDGDRSGWPWLPGTIVGQVGEDEWDARVEAPEMAEAEDDGVWFPVCFRDSSEIRLRQVPYLPVSPRQAAGIPLATGLSHSLESTPTILKSLRAITGLRQTAAIPSGAQPG